MRSPFANRFAPSQAVAHPLLSFKRGSFITFKIGVMLALQQEALCVEELSFPGSDAQSQGEDAGTG